MELDKEDNPFRIENVGSRIFSEGRNPKDKSTLAATRREARSARRRRDRYKQRQRFLLNELEKAGLFPKEESERKRLQSKDPLELRANALKKKLTPYEIGRALFHINQRRGFKSNRKDRNEEVTSGKVNNSVIDLLTKMKLMKEGPSDSEYKALSKEEKKKAREDKFDSREKAMKKLIDDKSFSFGSFLWEQREEGLPTRARPNADSKLYDFYPTRELLEDEFQKIWNAQKKHHKDLLTEKLCEDIHSAIFTQRPLKPQTVGKCAHVPQEDRTFRAMPTFQRYRIYQEVNNLEWRTPQGQQKLRDYPEARDAIIELLEKPTTKNGNVVFGNMKKVLKRMEIFENEIVFNFEGPKRKGFDGNLTSNLMSDEDRVGDKWHEWDLKKQDKFIETILDNEKTDEEVCEQLIKEYGLSKESAHACSTAPLTDGTASLSLKAAALLMEEMRDNYCIQSDAVQIVADREKDFNDPFKRASEGQVLDSLPYYGEAFQDGRHIIPGKRESTDIGDDLKYFGGVTNPTVHIALNQIRHVINEIIDTYGHPASISIELARDLPLGKEGRSGIEKVQSDNQKRNDEFKQQLKELKQTVNAENILRLHLWHELDENDPNGRRCPFTGEKIKISDVFSGKFEIEHLIPRSRSLDNSRANKVLAARKANRYKGKRTPYEAFGNSPSDYSWEEIFARSQKLPKQKQWRFQEDAWEMWTRGEEFTSRHLNDTRYIGRLTREYLENICPHNKIDVLTGRLTSLLRWHWGLHKDILPSNLNGKGNVKRKNRDDHRHHAIDAVVVAMTTDSTLRKVATAAGRAEDLNVDKLFPQNANGKSAIDPWDTFREDVKEAIAQIVVSHKVKYKKPPSLEEKSKVKNIVPKTTGQLHEDSAYGIIREIKPGGGRYEVVRRKPIESFTSKKHFQEIRDLNLRNIFLKAFESGSKEEVAKVANQKGVKSLRYVRTLGVIPIQDKSGKKYKAYLGGNNWGLEVYEYPAGDEKAGKWFWNVISNFIANQQDFQPGVSQRPHPAARLVMRLHINNLLEIEIEGGDRQIVRVQKFSKDYLQLAEHNEANTRERNDSSNDPFEYISIRSSGKFKSYNPRKLHISPTGKMNYEKRSIAGVA